MENKEAEFKFEQRVKEHAVLRNKMKEFKNCIDINTLIDRLID